MTLLRCTIILLVILGLPSPSVGQEVNSNGPRDSSAIRIQGALADVTALIKGLENDIARLRDSLRTLRNAWNANLSSQAENQQTLRKTIDENMDSINTVMKSYERELKQSLEQLNSLTDTTHSHFRYLNGQLTGMKEAQAQVDTRTDSLAMQTESKLIELKNSIQRRLLVNGFAFIVVLATLILGFIKIRKAINSSERGLEESLKLDTMLNSILENQFRFKKDSKAQTGSDRPEADLDHTLPIRVGEEIYRMRLRIAHMDEDTKGIVALKNSLARLEDEFNTQGYSIRDLTGQSYTEQMTAIVKNWESRNEIEPGEQKIIRMIKPQVVHKDVVVSPGEMIVGISISNSIH